MRRPLLLLTTAALALGGATTADAAQTSGFGAPGKLYFSSDRSGSDELYRMNADGTGVERLTNDSSYQASPVVSPDGTKVLFCGVTGGSGAAYHVHVMDADGKNQKVLTQDLGGTSCQATWSPDGTRIAFMNQGSLSAGYGDVWTMNADGSGKQNITNNGASESGPVWSPDGSRIVFSSSRDGEGLDIWSMGPDGSNPVNLTSRPGYDDAPVISPDGGSIAYQSTAGPEERMNIWVMRIDGSDKRMVTTKGGNIPVFSPDGRQIAFEGNRLDAAGSSDVFVIDSDGTGERNLTHDGSPYRQDPGGGAYSNADSPGSWAPDRSVAQPPVAPVAFPATVTELRRLPRVNVYRPQVVGSRLVKTGIDLYTTTPIYDRECGGQAVLRFTAGKKLLLRKVVTLAPRRGTCGTGYLRIRLPRGPRAITLTGTYLGNDSLRGGREVEKVVLPG